MGRLKKVISYEDARPMGIGRIVAVENSTSGAPGILIASGKGLFHAELPKSDGDINQIRLKKIRRNPVGWLISGDSGVVLYEEVKGHGRIAIFDSKLNELLADTALAREISPRAIHDGGERRGALRG